MAGTVKRSRRKQARTYQSTSFSETGKPGNGPPVVVLSSNFSIGPLLARGALLPEALEGEAISAGAEAGRLRWSQGALPAAWVAALVESARNVIPIAIRLQPERQVRELAIPGYVGTIDGICGADVAGLFFRTEKERVRFESLEFSNYDLAAVDTSLGVDASLFEATVNEGIDSTNVNPSQAVPTPDATAEASGQAAATASLDDEMQAVRSADCMTGLLAFLLTASPGTRAWMQGVQRLFTNKTKGSPATWPERLAYEALGNPTDESAAESALLTALVDVVRRYPVEIGWPAEQVLAEVTASARGRIEPQNERAVGELERWATRASDILASKAEPQSLADDGFVLQRAALLLLLRGDLDGLEGGEAELTGPQSPGPLVRGTASALAALRTGLRAMPARHKKAAGAKRPGHWLAYLGEVFVALLQTRKPTSLVPPDLPIPNVTYRSIRTLRGEWIVSVASREVARTPVEVDHGLERLLAMGQHLGFEVEEHGDNGLRVIVPLGDARRHPVFLELIRTDQGSRPVVRFSTPTRKVMAVGARRGITRNLALDLLKRNADPGMNCRFAINKDATEVLVLVDQLLATLDEVEFLQHIKQVASSAEDFEQSPSVRAGLGHRSGR